MADSGKRPNRPHFGTRVIHAGQSPDPSTGAIMPPIYATSTYVQESPGVHKGYEYSRSQNPTRMAYERCIADLESGTAGFAFASGMAATATILELLDSGSHVVAIDDLYGGSYRLFENVRRDSAGLTFSFVDLTAPDALEAAIRPETRMIWVESPTNPLLKVVDLEAIARLGRARGILTCCDNTFATPYLCRPLSWGATIVVHSATKFIGGHGNSIGGVIIDAGEFDFSRYPTIAAPSPSYHDLRFFDTFGRQAFLLKARVETLRDTGACLSPFNAFLLLQGLETLSVRTERHVANAQAVAEFLEAHPQVDAVAYPGLPENPYHELAQKYLPQGPGAIFSFEVKAGPDGARAAGKTFIEALQLFSHLANVGDAKSLVIHPASTTHQQLSDEELEQSGVGPGLIRLSIGLETLEDLLWDLDQALLAISR